MSDKPQSTTTNAPRCELCGGKIRSDNNTGICGRNAPCRNEFARRRYAAKRPPKQACTLCGGNMMAGAKHGVCLRNPLCAAENKRRRVRRSWEINNPKFAARNRQRESARRRYEANRENINRRARLKQKAERALRGDISLSRSRGHLHPLWEGGRTCYCAVPGCDRVAGWKGPQSIRKNKTGFRCSVHKNVRFPRTKENPYEHQPPEQIRSSVA